MQIKVIDPVKKTCESFLGTGKPGLSSGEGNAIHFDEPGGLCVSPDGETLYVADTNNHAIRVIDLKTKKVSQVRVDCFLCLLLQNVNVELKHVFPATIDF